MNSFFLIGESMVQMNTSGWLPDNEFAKAVDALPLVSVDLVLVNTAGQICC
jgi:hypothetical protein